MATAETKSYVEQIKEMRALRMQQLKQVNADQRYQSAMISYQRNILRTNEKMINSITSLGRTITGMVSTIGKVGGAAVSTAASGVSNVSTSIVSGLGKVLPLAIAGLLAKVMLWDNMSGDTQSRLSGAFGSLFKKLFSFVENTFDEVTAGIMRTVQQIKDAYKSLDIKFPIVNTVIKKMGAFMDMVAAGFEIVKPFFEGIIDLVKADPTKVMTDTLKIMAGGVLLRYMIPVAASIVTTLLANRLLVNSMIRSLGAGAGAGMLGSTLMGAGAAGAATGYGVSKFRAGRGTAPAVKASERIAARELAKKAAAEAALARGVGGRAFVLVPYVGWMLATGFTIYEVYTLFRDFGISEEEVDGAVALSNGEDLEMSRGLVPMGIRAPKPTAENIRQAAEYEKASRSVDLSGGGGLVGGEMAQLEEIRKMQLHSDIVKAYKNREKQKEREEKGQDLEIIKEYNRLWGSFSPSERKFAIDSKYIIIETADFYYYPDEKGKMVRIARDKYDEATQEIINENITEEDKGSFKTGLIKLISKHEAFGSYDMPFGGTMKDGKVVPKYVPFPEGISGISQMTGKQVLDYQQKQIEATKGLIGKGPNIGTGAVGGLQFNRGNVKEFYDRHPELLDKPFSPEVQQMLFDEFANGKIKGYLASNDMKGLQEFVRTHWEIFSKSTGASKELADYFKNPTTIVDNKLSDEERRKLSIKRFEEAKERFFAPVTKEELDLMTIQGESAVGTVVNKAKDYLQERKDSIRNLLEKQRKALDPKELTSELMDTLKIINEVNEAKSGTNTSSAGDTIINNINNVSSSSGGSSGGSREVYPVTTRNNYEHRTMSGLV